MPLTRSILSMRPTSNSPLVSFFLIPCGLFTISFLHCFTNLLANRIIVFTCEIVQRFQIGDLSQVDKISQRIPQQGGILFCLAHVILPGLPLSHDLLRAYSV